MSSSFSYEINQSDGQSLITECVVELSKIKRVRNVVFHFRDADATNTSETHCGIYQRIVSYIYIVTIVRHTCQVTIRVGGKRGEKVEKGIEAWTYARATG